MMFDLYSRTCLSGELSFANLVATAASLGFYSSTFDLVNQY